MPTTTQIITRQELATMADWEVSTEQFLNEVEQRWDKIMRFKCWQIIRGKSSIGLGEGLEVLSRVLMPKPLTTTPVTFGSLEAHQASLEGTLDMSLL